MEYRLLGPTQILNDAGEELALGGPKQRALLVILLLRAGEAVTIDRLVEDLWGDRPPDTAANTLQVYASQIGKILRAQGGSTVLFGRGDLQLEHPGEQLDINRFARLTAQGRQALATRAPELAAVRLRDALALWRGHPLSDLTDEPFAKAEIERLEELRATATEDRLEADLALGLHEELITELEAFAEQHPGRERPVGQLMLALHRAGRRDDALAVYGQARHRFSIPHGGDAQGELGRLHEAILRGEAWLDLPSVRTTSGAAEPPDDVPSEVPHLALGEMTSVIAVAMSIDPPHALTRRMSPAQVGSVLEELTVRLRSPFEEAGASLVALEPLRILALFGHPAAKEGDPERAARAALRAARDAGSYAYEIRRSWGARAPGARITMAAGLVALREAEPEAELRTTVERIAPMDEAVAMLDDANPGAVLLAGSAARRLPKDFISDPSGVTGRYVLRGMEVEAPLGPFIDRTDERQRLARAIEGVRSGRGTIVLIEGEAGIGKTRLLAEVQAEADDATWLEIRCAGGAGAPFRPVVELLRSRLSEPEGDERAETAPGDDADEDASLRAVAESGRVRDAEVFVSDVIAWVRRLSNNGPTVVLFDDLHDADADTFLLIQRLLQVAEHTPLLIMLTTRSDGARTAELRRGLAVDDPHRTEHIPLEPFDDIAARELADALSPTGALDPAWRERVVARAGGNPLFIEELIHLTEEAGAVNDERRWTLSSSTMATLLPPALEALLLGRIHRLPDGARAVIQTAAVFDREFDLASLGEVVGHDPAADISTLLVAGLVREVGRAPARTFAIKHPMMKEAALASLTPARARAAYGEVARTVERLAATGGERLPELLGYYFYRSDEPGRAVDYLEEAAQVAETSGAIDRATDLRARAARASQRANVG